MENKQPAQEQIKEFWEWCGVSLRHEWDNEYLGYETNGCFCTRCGVVEDYTLNKEPCLLPIDLNNLFKYAVPKLDSLTDMNLHRRGEEWKVDLIFYDIPAVRGIDANLALALFWAIWEVKHGS